MTNNAAHLRPNGRKTNITAPNRRVLERPTPVPPPQNRTSAKPSEPPKTTTT